jgi:hypothetical protein
MKKESWSKKEYKNFCKTVIKLLKKANPEFNNVELQKICFLISKGFLLYQSNLKNYLSCVHKNNHSSYFVILFANDLYKHFLSTDRNRAEGSVWQLYCH